MGADVRTFRFPDRIDLSIRRSLLDGGRFLGFSATLSAVNEGFGLNTRPTPGRNAPKPSRPPRHFTPRVRFALASHSLVRQFVAAEDAADVLHALQVLRDDVEHRQADGYSDHHIPWPSASSYPGPKAKESLLYLMVRTLHPDLVVETGVDQGISSLFILEGLRQNGSGRLHSIDIGGNTECGNPVGWLVPNELRERWTLTLQPAQLALPKIEAVPDLFLHDSLHTFDHMTFELEWAAQQLRPEGILACDDINMNAAYRLFLARHRLDFTPLSEGVVGVARKRG